MTSPVKPNMRHGAVVTCFAFGGHIRDGLPCAKPVCEECGASLLSFDMIACEPVNHAEDTAAPDTASQPDNGTPTLTPDDLGKIIWALTIAGLTAIKAGQIRVALDAAALGIKVTEMHDTGRPAVVAPF